MSVLMLGCTLAVFIQDAELFRHWQEKPLHYFLKKVHCAAATVCLQLIN